MTKTEFIVDIELLLPDPVTEGQLDKVFDSLENGTDFMGAPAVGGRPDPHKLGASYNVEAPSATHAIEKGLLAICKGLGCQDDTSPGTVVEVNVEPYIDPDQRELGTKAEIARRLELSRVRVQELAARDGFPPPRQGIGSRSVLYRWGDVKDWNEQRL